MVATTGSGTAVSGVNFSPVARTLAFGKGVRTQSFSVPVLDDHVVGPDLSVGLTLSVPKPKSAPGLATLVIHNVDQPPPPPPSPPPGRASIRFSAVSYAINEDAGVAEVQVTRTGDLPDAVTVTVATNASGNAVAGVNFTPSRQTLSFGPGVATQTFDVPILDDHAVDPDLSVGLSLGAAGENAVLVTPDVATLVIHNVDPPTDLVIQSLQATPIAGGQYSLTAVVTNEGSSYAGGGYVSFLKNSGTTILNPPNADGSPPSPLAVASKDEILLSLPIPAMAFAQTLTFTTTSTSRALFKAEISPDSMNPTPGIAGVTGTTGAEFAIDNLDPQQLSITSLLLSSALKLNGASASIDGSNSSINIPGLINKTFSVPSFQALGATYATNKIIANSFGVSVNNGAIVLTIGFADNPQALISSGLPSIGVKGLSLTLTLPVVFDANDQYIQIVNPTVVAHGTWKDSLFGVDLSSTVNNVIQTNLGTFIGSTSSQESIEFGLNSQIRNSFIGSRILRMTSALSSLTLGLESP